MFLELSKGAGLLSKRSEAEDLWYEFYGNAGTFGKIGYIVTVFVVLLVPILYFARRFKRRHGFFPTAAMGSITFAAFAAVFGPMMLPMMIESPWYWWPIGIGMLGGTAVAGYCRLRVLDNNDIAEREQNRQASPLTTP